MEKSTESFTYKIESTKAAEKQDDLPGGENAETKTPKERLDYLYEANANRKPLILAVDDSPDILAAVAAVLGDEYKVFKLPKPAMLENVLKQVTPDLFLLDYQMPELNGFELISIIRGYEKYKTTPIIFLTSEDTMDHIAAAIGLGASDYIVKPFNKDILREKVSKHIKEPLRKR
ncbi:MAG: response regulator [Acidobacteriota bacterium]|jgi:putative two-component system response regulator|nr:response regulator [Acidobacteriota bacterium]